MQVRIPAVYMRGGTSKGLFFHAKDLPRDLEARDQIILTAYGSPDPYKRQINGMGGGVSVTSKVAIIEPSLDPTYDVNYLFGQVLIDRPGIRYRGNCGNLSSAVGPFAVDEGLVSPEEPISRIRIFQVNTRKLIVAEIPVRQGFHEVNGDFSIDGVPGTGAMIKLHFEDPGGSVTKKLLPTGNAREQVDCPGIGKVDVSIVDASNPVAFVRAMDIGLRGTEIEEIDADAELRKRLEAIRGQCAVILGLAPSMEQASKLSQDVPKIAVVSGPQGYRSIAGRDILKKDVDLVARIMSVGSLHKTYAITGGICTAGACVVGNTVVHEVVRKNRKDPKLIRIGHPGGQLGVEVEMEENKKGYHYKRATVCRTARRLMDGYVYVP